MAKMGYQTKTLANFLKVFICPANKTKITRTSFSIEMIAVCA
jgi:hypothetical protein